MSRRHPRAMDDEKPPAMTDRHRDYHRQVAALPLPTNDGRSKAALVLDGTVWSRSLMWALQVKGWCVIGASHPVAALTAAIEEQATLVVLVGDPSTDLGAGRTPLGGAIRAARERGLRSTVAVITLPGGTAEVSPSGNGHGAAGWAAWGRPARPARRQPRCRLLRLGR